MNILKKPVLAACADAAYSLVFYTNPYLLCGGLFGSVVAAVLALRHKEKEAEYRKAMVNAVARKRAAELRAERADTAMRLAENERRRVEEARRRVEEERTHAEGVLREAQQRMREQEGEARRQAEGDMKRRAAESRVQEEEARRREEEANRREREARMHMEEANRQADEERRRAEEVRKEAEEFNRQADEALINLEQARRRAEEQWRRGIPPEFRPSEEDKQRFQQQYGIQSHKINIAIVGESGMGKSSFLNSVRGLSPTSQGAARCGFNETTGVVRGYSDLHNPNIMWYDVPGANTPSVKGWTYFATTGLFVFDVMIIVFADRFTENAGTLISNANKCSIPAFLVRTKADQLIQNAKEDSDGRLSDQEARELVVAKTREMVDFNLDQLELPRQRVYLVSKTGMRRFIINQDTTNLIDEKLLLEDLIPHEIVHEGTDSLSSILFDV